MSARTGVTVKNTEVHGSLLLAEGIKEGDVTLAGVTVTGKTVIKGGGSHSVVFSGAQLNDVSINKPGSPVRVVLQNGTHAQQIRILTPTDFEWSQDSEVGTVQVKSNDVTINDKPVPAGTETSLGSGRPVQPIRQPQLILQRLLVRSRYRRRQFGQGLEAGLE